MKCRSGLGFILRVTANGVDVPKDLIQGCTIKPWLVMQDIMNRKPAGSVAITLRCSMAPLVKTPKRISDGVFNQEVMMGGQSEMYWLSKDTSQML